MTRGSDRRSPLALVLLALLAEEPMHPYRMQQVIRERGKDKIANVAQRNSVYQTIERLLRAGFIVVRETEREERRPERTIYDITDEGWTALRAWARGMLAAPRREFPEFPAALTSLTLLDPPDVLAQLEHRAQALRAEVANARAAVAAVPDLPRLFLLDDEYLTALRTAELRWVEGVLADLRAGRLSWSEEWINEVASAMEDVQTRS